MSGKPTNGNDDGNGGRRKRARRNAWLLAAIAAAIYVGYLLYLGTLGPGG